MWSGASVIYVGFLLRYFVLTGVYYSAFGFISRDGLSRYPIILKVLEI